MKVTELQLRQMMPNAGARLDPHLPYIVPAMMTARIDTPETVAAFLAELAHESGEYRYMEELADGSAYEGRADLGNIEPGDGVRFKGHGPIQITGRANHMACGAMLGIDLIAEPRLICTPRYGTASACWFWNFKKLSPLAERGWFKTISRIINGGENGMADRLHYWEVNRDVLGLPPVDHKREEESIAAFQAANGLTPDGVAGPMTRRALAA